jgi:hypothetical protein
MSEKLAQPVASLNAARCVASSSGQIASISR